MPLVPAVATQLSPPPSTARVEYRVQVYAFRSADRGPGTLVCEFSNPKNIGYADYLNDVPEAFFTIDQDDLQLPMLRGYEGKAHVWIWRGDHLAWTGFFGMEVNANSQDAIFYCFGYLAALYWEVTEWSQEWLNALVGTIANDLWLRAKGGLVPIISTSNLTFVGTGLIESPMTTSGGAVNIVFPTYRTFNKRLLFAFQELAALGMSDTTNQVVFEITHDRAPMFNFFRNYGTDRSDVVLEWGGRYIRDFSYQSAATSYRNHIIAVGADPHQLIMRTVAEDTAGIVSYGIRQEPIFLSWVRDDTELNRVAKRRLAMALQAPTDLVLRLFPNTLLPPGTRGAAFNKGDRVKVKITKGIVNVDAYRLVRGYRVVALQDGAEHVQLLTQVKPGV